ncbi:hypothetical protein TH728_02910 [Corynebacterium amycolatum]|uniref:hypothetical protein n=1 Tax=Corynebacterium amycolatum TaxID=43765 RepID=UPI002AAEF36B|nr:hypothetical protein [Corynebacterium amycolatum]MDY7341377.1 hypothetical protein [Corynebacterium amycolatum]
MTPEEARQLLDGTTTAPWKVDKQSYGEVVVDFWVTDRDDNKVAEKTCLDIEVYEVGRNFNLVAAAPDMANMIANMRTEYSVRLPDGQLNDIGWGDYDAALEDKNTWRRYGFDAYIVVRYVTAPQPLGEEQ